MMCIEAVRIKCARRHWLSAVCLGVALVAGCVDASRPVDKNVQSFFQRVDGPGGGLWLEDESPRFIQALSPAVRGQIAERAVTHQNPDVRLFGVQQLYALGQDRRADEAAAQLVIDDVDVTGLGWAWLHSGDPTLMERRLQAIGRALTQRYPSLTPEQKRRAKKFVCDSNAHCELGEP
jgi:hypothetical protein